MQSYKFMLFVFLTGVMLIFCGFNVVSAQRIVNVSPGLGTLNDTIDGDTTATGERVDLNTIYVLERGGLYLTTGEIENNFPLKIKAAEGDGPRPIIRPAVVTGGESFRPFTPTSDLYIEGAYVTAKDVLGGVKSRIIRVKADFARIEIVDCHLDSAAQAAFRLDNDSCKVFIRNSIISNIAGDYDNGRGIDDRGNVVDSIDVVNTTWYNIASRVLRDGGKHINYARFDHNTIVNTGRRVGKPGEVVEFHFTNNLMINHSILGVDTASTRAAVEVDSLTSAELVGKTQIIDIRNNNFYRDPAFDAVYGDSIVSIPLFNPAAEAYIAEAGTGNTIYDEAITFTNGPIPKPEMVTTYYASGEDKLSYSDEPFDTSGEPFDFSYSMSAQAYTRGTDGLPLGDLNWFGLATSVDELPDSGIPTNFRLLQNYPNPFNPSTNIAYTLPKAARVKLTIYNLVGQKVMTLVQNKTQAAGTHTVEWNGKDSAGRLVSSGVYLYRLEAGDFVKSNKMLLLK